jgi:hypothetical protein
MKRLRYGSKRPFATDVYAASYDRTIERNYLQKWRLLILEHGAIGLVICCRAWISVRE